MLEPTRTGTVPGFTTVQAAAQYESLPRIYGLTLMARTETRFAHVPATAMADPPQAPVVLALTIGQSPRPALCSPLKAMLPASVRLLEVGALDDVDEAELALLTARAESPDAAYPLITSMRDGRTVRVEESDLCRLLNMALRRALSGADAASCRQNEVTGVCCAVLLCAGSFASVRTWPSSVPLLKPFSIAQTQIANGICARTLAILCPRGQERAIAERWAGAGFIANTLAVPLEESTPCSDADAARIAAWVRGMASDGDTGNVCVVIDFVGSVWAEQVSSLAQACAAPVVDLGECTFRVCAALAESACKSTEM